MTRTNLTSLLAGIAFFLTSHHVNAVDVYFIPPSEGQTASQPRRVAEDGSDPELCRSEDSLPGLNMTREVLGLPTCAGGSFAPTELASQLDILILVDDTRAFNLATVDRIDSMVGERMTCSATGRSQRVFPNFVVVEGDQGSMNILIVGESMIETYFREEPNNNEPWERHLQRIVARRNGTDASPDSGVSPSINSRAANNLPAGKGLFNLQVMHRLVSNRHKPYKMDHMASRFRDNGLNWFAVTANVAEKCEGALYTEYLRFGNPNFQTFVWSLNEPDNIEEQVDQLIRAARNVRAVGIMVDIEGSFRNHDAEARRIYALARQKAAEFESQPGGWPLSVGITVIGFPRRNSYINLEDLQDADFIMPQIYNRGDNLNASAIRQRIDFWLRVAPETPVVLLAGAHHCTIANNQCTDQRDKTSEEFANSLSPFRGVAREAIGWWRYGNVENGNHWDAIREFRLEP